MKNYACSTIPREKEVLLNNVIFFLSRGVSPFIKNDRVSMHKSSQNSFECASESAPNNWMQWKLLSHVLEYFQTRSPLSEIVRVKLTAYTSLQQDIVNNWFWYQSYQKENNIRKKQVFKLIELLNDAFCQCCDDRLIMEINCQLKIASNPLNSYSLLLKDILSQLEKGLIYFTAIDVPKQSQSIHRSSLFALPNNNPTNPNSEHKSANIEIDFRNNVIS
jgi:hypothetical protein